MTGGDRVKLKNAGFRVFSKDIIKRMIYELEYGTRLKHQGPFETRAALNRALDELMQDPKHISI